MSETGDALREALRADLLAHGFPENDLLGDFIVISCGVALADDMTPISAYWLTFSEETMLPHIARGLLAEGMDRLLTGVRIERDDE